MMTLEQLIEQARTNLAGLLETRQTKTAALVELRDAETLDEAAVTAAIAERDALDPQITAARARVEELEAEKARDDAAADLAARFTPRQTNSVKVGAEPETYRRGGEVSYFRDLYMATTHGRRDSIERLARNDQEVRAIGTTDTAGGEFVPPLWMVEDYEKVARAGRVVADRLNRQPLPGGTDAISLPIISTGTSVAEQTEGQALSETDMVTTSTTAAVKTMGGVQTVNLQLVEQSPINIDPIVFEDLVSAHAKAVDTFVIANNAANARGLLNVSGINAVTYTDASPTVPELWPKLVDAARQIHAGRFLPAQEIYMHPNRWAWLQAALDSNSRPYVTDDIDFPLLGIGDESVPEGLAGKIRGIGLPVFLDANIPVNLGAGNNEDRIIVVRPQDSVLYESTPQAETFRETKAKEVQVVFRLYNYIALLSARAPKSISVIAGTGLTAPTF